MEWHNIGELKEKFYDVNFLKVVDFKSGNLNITLELHSA